MEILFLIVMAYITAELAKKKGYNFATWFFIGLLTGGIAIIITLFLPVKKTT